jgi:plastocyanin
MPTSHKPESHKPEHKVEPKPDKKGVPGNVVRITSSGFSPKSLAVPVGLTVYFRNEDTVSRNVTFDAAMIISADVAPGEEFQHTVTAVGEHAYHDKTSPESKGVIKAS